MKLHSLKLCRHTRSQARVWMCLKQNRFRAHRRFVRWIMLLMPHDASYSDASFHLLKTRVIEEALRVCDGAAPLHVVNAAQLGLI